MTKFYIMSTGADGEPVPDEWISEWGFHLTDWWAPFQIHQPQLGDIVIQASIITNKMLGIFEMTRTNGQNVPHPTDPKRWPWDIGLRPHVLWDGSVAPTIDIIGYSAPRVYEKIDSEREQAVHNLIRYHALALSQRLIAGVALQEI